MKRIMLWTVAVVGGSGVALAQTPAPTTPMPTMPAEVVTPGAVTPGAVTPGSVVPGANSFTEAQARSRIEKAGYTDVGALVKSDDGIWRGTAKKDGADVTAAVDFKGNVITR